MAGPMPPIPNVISVQLRGTTPGEIWENVLYYSYTGPPPSSANCQSFATDFSGVWGNSIAQLCPSPIILTEVVVTDLNSATGGQGIDSTHKIGTRGDDVIGSNTAFLVSYPVPLRFRGGHFRTYLLVGGNADNADGMSWHPAFVTEATGQWNNFLNGLYGATVGSTTLASHVAVRRHGKFLPNEGPPHYVLNNPIVMPIPQGGGVGHAQMASQKGRIGRRSK